MYGIVDLADQYFVEMINDEDFVIGLDSTGVYALTDSTNREEVLLALRHLKKDLGLKDSEVVLCFVGEPQNLFQNEVTYERFEQWLRDITSHRMRIFSRQTLQEIEDCYKEGIEEYSSLINVLRELGLTDGVIHSIIEKKPQNLREVKELGVVQEVAEEVFRILCDGYYESKEEQDGVPSGISVSLLSFQKRKCTISLVFAVAGGVLTIYTGQPLIALIFSAFGVYFAKKAMKAGSFSPAQVAIVMNSIIIGVTGLTITIEIIIAIMGAGAKAS